MKILPLIGYMLLWSICIGAQEMTEFEQMLLTYGLKESVTDYSKEEEIQMAEPRLAYFSCQRCQHLLL